MGVTPVREDRLVSGDKEYELRRASGEAAEAAAISAFETLLPLFARALAPVWRFGDGDGGTMMSRIREAVYGELGWEWPPPPRTPAAKKASISAALRRQVFERDAYRCVQCGDWHDLEPDHIVPEARGGPTTLENLQTLCRPCNLAKGARIDD